MYPLAPAPKCAQPRATLSSRRRCPSESECIATCAHLGPYPQWRRRMGGAGDSLSHGYGIRPSADSEADSVFSIRWWQPSRSPGRKSVRESQQADKDGAANAENNRCPRQGSWKPQLAHRSRQVEPHLDMTWRRSPSVPCSNSVRQGLPVPPAPPALLAKVSARAIDPLSPRGILKRECPTHPLCLSMGEFFAPYAASGTPATSVGCGRPLITIAATPNPTSAITAEIANALRYPSVKAWLISA